jgi:2-phosphosulfolactate phosphatase
MPKWLDIALIPAEAAAMDADCYVVVDVLRATTTIAALFAGGLKDLLVVATIDEARERARRESRLLFGEVNGLPPPGFDFGNSPVEALRAEIGGRGAVLFTTNGTSALCALAGRGAVFTGALSNAPAIAERVAAYERVVLVCAGTEGGRRFALEDFAASAEIARRVARVAPGLELGDAAGLALTSQGFDDYLASALPQQTAPSTRLITSSVHGRRLVELGLAADVQFALRIGTSQATPLVVADGAGWARLEDSAR